MNQESNELESPMAAKLSQVSDKTIINFIKQHCAEYYNMNMSDYLDPSRKREVVTLKKTAAYFIKKYVKSIPLLSIGAQFNNLNHATILHYIRTIQDIAVYDKTTNQDLKAIDFEIRKFIDKMLLKLQSDDAIIDLNDIHLLVLDSGKHVILKGFNETDLKDVQNHFGAIGRRIKETGMYLLNNEEELN